MTSRVAVLPVETVADTPEALLDYLVRRTAVTIGALVDRADGAIVGEVRQIDASNVSVRAEDLEALGPWLSGESDAPAHIVVVESRISVTEWLAGGGTAAEIRVVAVPRRSRAVASDDVVPTLTAGDFGVFFLRRVPPSLPYASYLPGDAFQLAAGESGPHAFDSQKHDQRGVEAIRWYAAARANLGRLRAGLDCENRIIVNAAIRELAVHHVEGAARRLGEMLRSATGDLRLELTLGLWILGEREAAITSLDGLMREDGTDRFLEHWQLKRSSAEDGATTGTLFGPKA